MMTQSRLPGPDDDAGEQPDWIGVGHAKEEPATGEDDRADGRRPADSDPVREHARDQLQEGVGVEERGVQRSEPAGAGVAPASTAPR
jgi:hypothetical protein